MVRSRASAKGGLPQLGWPQTLGHVAFILPLHQEQIGPYRIVREIGRGGMGAVYLGERADAQFEMRVALKVIKRGMDSDAVLQRFRHERQILDELEFHLKNVYVKLGVHSKTEAVVRVLVDGIVATTYAPLTG